MRRRPLAILLLITVLTGMLFALPVHAEGENGKNNRYNVVLVMDASASMLNTDPHGYRYGAVEMFVDLLADGGNYVGSVTFGKEIVGTYPIREIRNATDKQNLLEHIKSQPLNSYTDIGTALLTAEQMLGEQGNAALPSLILFLSDGNTELASKEDTNASLEKKETALEIARDRNYPIYTISLNADGLAKTEELRQIAKATGGSYIEVNRAKDLNDGLRDFYQKIFSTESVVLYDSLIPESGCVTATFEIEDDGIEEVNILLYGEITRVDLINPSGKTQSEMQNACTTYRGQEYTLLKVAEPDMGVWQVVGYGSAGASIQVIRIYNTDLRVVTTVKEAADVYHAGQTVTFKTQIISDRSGTEKDNGQFTATLVVLDHRGNPVEEKRATTTGTNAFEITYTLPSIGTLYATVFVAGKSISTHSDTFVFNIDNTAPVPVKDEVRFHINRWPFLLKTNATMDLTGLCTDGEGDPITYSVESSTWMESDYTLEGSLLTIREFSVAKGSFDVRATDPAGASCLFRVRVTSANVGLWLVILILGGGLLTLAIAGLVTYRKLGLPFSGTFNVENLQTGDTANRQKNRGRLRVGSLNIEPTGFERSAYFQATGKNFVYFISPKPVYSDAIGGKAKKIRIDGGMEIRISPTEEFETGITVRFESLLDNPDFDTDY